jgi:putative addiction module component (TIGR02574 family)
MDAALPLDKMSVEDKLRALEQLWESLEKTPAAVPSPAWHRDVIEAREKRIRVGQEGFIPWEKARAQIRKRKS